MVIEVSSASILDPANLPSPANLTHTSIYTIGSASFTHDVLRSFPCSLQLMFSFCVHMHIAFFALILPSDLQLAIFTFNTEILHIHPVCNSSTHMHNRTKYRKYVSQQLATITLLWTYDPTRCAASANLTLLH